MKNVLVFAVITLSFGYTYCQSDSSDYYYRKGLEEKSNHLYMVAFNDLQKSTKFRIDNADAQRELGLTSLELRKYDNAEMAFQMVEQINKDDKVAVENLANLYFWTHQWPEAIEYGKKAQQMSVGKNWNYMIGKSYYQQEDYGNSFKYLQAAAKDDTANAEIPYLQARSFVDMNNYKAAIAFFKRAIFLDSSKFQWIYECALTFATIPDDKSAIQYYLLAAQKGYKIDNDYYENLSDSYIAAGEAEKGLDLMLKVLEKKPADLVLLYSVADTYYRLKKYQEAIDYWDKILYFDKENAKALYMIGMAYQKKGETAKGRQLCDKAIEMDPSLKNLKHEIKMDM
ncbi:MAG TPA: tetratricopeptide repeat protein [Puia sp.]|nr:tetratricopeptide repeat protein [Puia sp.]